MEPILRQTLPAAIIIAAFLMKPIAPEPIVLAVDLSEVEMPASAVTITQEPSVIHVEMQPATANQAPARPMTVVVEPSPVLPPEVIYEERIVEVTRTVEVPACLDYGNLPDFNLPNALGAAFPGAQWSLSGDQYSGLVWHDDTPKPTFTQILGGWLTYLEQYC